MDGYQSSLGSAPAHITAGGGLRLNQAAQSGIQASFAVLKIKNRVFRIRYRGEERILQDSPGTGRDGRPLPVEPVTRLDVIVVGASQAISKRFYIGGYVEGDGKAPDCFSINGVSPDPASAQKQAPMCATCPKNMWGSSTTDDGRKSKACNDRRRIAVVPAADADNEVDGGPMLLDIPPASLKPLDAYTRSLDRRGADMSQVVTRIGFHPEKTLELTFEAVGWVTDAHAFDVAVEHGKSDQVRRMLHEEIVDVVAEGEAPALLGPKPDHLLARPSPAAQVAQAPAPVQAPAPAPAPKPPQAPSEPVNVPPPAPPPPPAPTPAAAAAPAPKAPTPAAPTIVQGAPPDMQSSIDDIDALLSNVC